MIDELNQDAPEVANDTAPVVETSAAEPSRREVIREAVDRQKSPDAEPKPAPKPGEPARAADGKFAPREATAPAIDKPAPVAKPDAPVAPVEAKPDAAVDAPVAEPVSRPPPGWSPIAKVAFDKLKSGEAITLTKDEATAIAADVVKREVEVNKGLSKLAEYKAVDKYMEMAKAGGTTIDKALENYVGIEQLLRRDVFGGVEQILKNVGVNPLAFAQAYLNRANGGDQTAPQPNPQSRQQPAIDPDQIVQRARAEIRAEMEQRDVMSQVERFAADPKNRFYENVKGQMARLAQSGFANDLPSLYDMACRMDPAIAPLLNQPAQPDPNAVRAAAANQAQRAAKATTGAPSAGQPVGRASNPNQSRRDVIREAVSAQRARG